MHYLTILLLPLLNFLTAKSQAYSSKHGSPIFIPDLPVIQDLYQTPSDFNTTSLFSPLIQQPLSLNPKPNSNPQPQLHGTIHMLPIYHGISYPQTLSLTFTTSREACAPISLEYTSVLEELAFNLLYDYPTGIHQAEPGSLLSSAGPAFILSETVFLHKNLYASLYLKISEDIEQEEWEKVVRLLTRTAEGVEEERRDIGLETGAGRISVFTKFGECEVDATWVFYRMVDGVVSECGEGNETLDISLGFGFDYEGVGKDAGGGKREDL
ncbi:hypothetical protein BJ875DRAFT_487671 [Amylocarpus encephaloides]|uniref:Ubiquitin 3 binding protein But2 C-terminal domain-containing protein n=1 Tax=Amylocarpus encephaloides TaxID=45428 RepID=A0A9P7YBN9_9HELO|nr:hypothetical protein BJ875DRAFT_487671 [Amylocarpus encephaloides]